MLFVALSQKSLAAALPPRCEARLCLAVSLSSHVGLRPRFGLRPSLGQRPYGGHSPLALSFSPARPSLASHRGGGAAGQLLLSQGSAAQKRTQSATVALETIHHDRCLDTAAKTKRGSSSYAGVNRSSILIGNSRTRTPVAWCTASVIAAATPASPISPIPRAPSSLISLSG